jgi:hypothetical protein
MKDDTKDQDETLINPIMSPDEIRAALGAFMGASGPTKEEFEELKERFDGSLEGIRDLSAKMATLKYTTIAIDGAAFNMSITVPELPLDEILEKIDKFYDKMIKKNIYAEAASDGGCDDAAFN